MLPAAYKCKDRALVSLGTANIGVREVCSSQEHKQNLPQDSSNITLSLGNSRRSETSLGDGPVFTVLQMPETLSQTNNSLQRIFACKAVWEKMLCDKLLAVSHAIIMSKYMLERWERWF